MVEDQKLPKIDPYGDIHKNDDKFELIKRLTADTKIHRILMDEFGYEKFYTMKSKFVSAEVAPLIEDDGEGAFFFGNPYNIIFTVAGVITTIFLSYRVLNIYSKISVVLDKASAAQDIKDKLDFAVKCKDSFSNLKISKKISHEIISEVIKESKSYINHEIDMSNIIPGKEKSFISSVSKGFLKNLKNEISFLSKQYDTADKVFEGATKDLLDGVQVDVLYSCAAFVGLVISAVSYKLLGESSGLE